MKAQADALLQALSMSGCDGAAPRMNDLVAALAAPLDETVIRLVLQELRSRRCFELMDRLATEARTRAKDGMFVHVSRQLAQAKIDRGHLSDAADILQSLAQQLTTGGSARERSEVNGLLGRVNKQRFVDAVKEGRSGADELRTAVAAYAGVYRLDPAWHGANLVALTARAERDHLSLTTGTAESWARRLLTDLADKPKASWPAWDFASAGEAFLALGEPDNIANSFASYWSSPGVDAFALEGTARNLREICGFAADSGDPMGQTLLTHLQARSLTAGGAAKFTAVDLAAFAGRLTHESGRAEATFGAGNAVPIEKVLGWLDKARSVCRISGKSNSNRGGTGFLVAGRHADPTAGRCVHSDQSPCPARRRGQRRAARHEEL